MTETNENRLSITRMGEIQNETETAPFPAQYVQPELCCLMQPAADSNILTVSCITDASGESCIGLCGNLCLAGRR